MPPKGYKLSLEAKERIRQGVLRRGVDARIDRNEIYSLYWDTGLSAREIGELKGVTEGCVFSWLGRFKIPRRSQHEAMKLHYQKNGYRLTGPAHPAWKGGRSGGNGGYISIHLYPDHPLYLMAYKEATGRGGWVFEHRLVMAQHLGRPLESWEVVHHINGIKDDNRIRNLELFPSQIAGHLSITLLKRRVRKQEKEIRLLRWQVRQLTRRLNRVDIPVPAEDYMAELEVE